MRDIPAIVRNGVHLYEKRLAKQVDQPEQSLWIAVGVYFRRIET